MSEITPDSQMANTTPATSAKKDHSLTPREQDLCLAIILSSKALEIDIKKFTHHGQFNTEKTAANTWGVIKKKLAAYNTGDDAAQTVISPKKRAAKADGDETPGSASKKRKSPSKSKPVKNEDFERDHDNE